MLLSNKQDEKKDTKPPSKSAGIERVEFQKRGRSNDSHEKVVSKAIKAGDGTRVVLRNLQFQKRIRMDLCSLLSTIITKSTAKLAEKFG